MKWTALLLGAGCALVLAGCDQSGMGGGKSIADLEKKIAAVEDQNRDLRAKMAAAQPFLNRSPLGNFFASPEFWQCTYDSSWSDCSSRCSKQTSDGYQACLANNPEGPKRQACVEENTQRGANCLANCPVQMSPINPAVCTGGGGIM